MREQAIGLKDSSSEIIPGKNQTTNHQTNKNKHKVQEMKAELNTTVAVLVDKLLLPAPDPFFMLCFVKQTTFLLCSLAASLC